MWRAGLLLVVLALPAAAQTCPTPAPARVTIQSLFDPIRQDTTQTVAGLERTARDAPGGGVHHHGRTAGLWLSEMVGEIRSEFQITRDGRSSCVAVTAVSGSFGFRNNRLLVARELNTNACARAAVIEHEEKHAAVDHAILTTHHPRLIAALQAAAARAEGDQAVLSQRLQAAFEQAFQAAAAERDQRQTAVDTPAEYARVSAMCNGAIGRLLGAPPPRR